MTLTMAFLGHHAGYPCWFTGYLQSKLVEIDWVLNCRKCLCGQYVNVDWVIIADQMILKCHWFKLVAIIIFQLVWPVMWFFILSKVWAKSLDDLRFTTPIDNTNTNRRIPDHYSCVTTKHKGFLLNFIPLAFKLPLRTSWKSQTL